MVVVVAREIEENQILTYVETFRAEALLVGFNQGLALLRFRSVVGYTLVSRFL
jgi:hypothetical protein